MCGGERGNVVEVGDQEDGEERSVGGVEHGAVDGGGEDGGVGLHGEVRDDVAVGDLQRFRGR